jgi:hypothetical protein
MRLQNQTDAGQASMTQQCEPNDSPSLWGFDFSAKGGSAFG